MLIQLKTKLDLRGRCLVERIASRVKTQVKSCPNVPRTPSKLRQGRQSKVDSASIRYSRYNWQWDRQLWRAMRTDSGSPLSICSYS